MGIPEYFYVPEVVARNMGDGANGYPVRIDPALTAVLTQSLTFAGGVASTSSPQAVRVLRSNADEGTLMAKTDTPVSTMAYRASFILHHPTEDTRKWLSYISVTMLS